MNSPIKLSDDRLIEWREFDDGFGEDIGYHAIIGSYVKAMIKKDSTGRHGYSWSVNLELVPSGMRPMLHGTTDSLEMALHWVHKMAFNMIMVGIIYGEEGVDSWRKSITEICHERRV